jgi:hypothetical protein
MLFAISATIYCTLTYVAGYKLFNMRDMNAYTMCFWLLSPISVPVGLLLVMTVG